MKYFVACSDVFHISLESVPLSCRYFNFIQGVQEKLCFFTIHCNPSLAYSGVRDLQSSQLNASVQSLLLAGNFCTTNSSRVLAWERWQTFDNSWQKNTIFNEHSVYIEILKMNIYSSIQN